MTNAKDGPAADAGELWDANDAARYLKVSRSWVYQRAEAGLLPCLRVGGLLRFDQGREWDAKSASERLGCRRRCVRARS
jgi:excisionase family DNA binding protein